MTATFHRRPLPDAQTALASERGRALFAEALAAGTMAGYFAVAEQFQTQAEPAYCGLTSLAVVLNSLAVDPQRVWKGPWRWFSEELLDCCVPLPTVRERGITFDELACLGRCNGAIARTWRASEHDVATLRAHVIDAATDPQAPRVIAAYARSALGQTGGGHFSPVAGYHAATDLALVLDVARFKYPPHWVSIAALHAAMLPPDPTTARSRGWITVVRAARPISVLLELRCDRVRWSDIGAALAAGRAALEALPVDATLDVRARAWLGAAAHLGDAIALRALDDDDARDRQDQVLAVLRQGVAAEVARAALTALDRRPPEPALATLLLLLAPADLPAAEALRALRADLPEPVACELAALDEQLAEVAAMAAAPAPTCGASSSPRADASLTPAARR
ncbi:MAG: phytochelatin synthase family protein [Kofleriaceae bacterium]